MDNKGFAGTQNNNIETPNDVSGAEKPLRPNRVDINVLKSKLQG